jgi:uncharacterized phiE125 gp8 family phage protein
MMLIEETTVPDAALPVEDFKAHLRLGTSFAQETVQDAVLTGFLRAAMAAIEARTGKVLMIREFSWSLHEWRESDAQGLPVAPVVQITRLAIVTRDGTETTVSPDAYWLERDSIRPRIRARGASLPTVPPGGSAVVQFEAGFSPIWSSLPADLKQAVLLLASHYYEFRHETSLSDGCMPFGVTSLIQRYKNLRIGTGGY